jgi:hypothetical protein
MNGLKDLLKKKDSIAKDAPQNKPAVLAVPEFRIIRTTTESEEVIEPPHFDGDDDVPPGKAPKKERRRTLFSRASSAATPKNASASKSRSSLESDDTKKLQSLPVRPKNERKLSERLHMGGRSRSKTNENTSAHLPENLPAAPDSVAVPTISVDGTTDEGNKYANAQREAQWEKRATILASSPSLLEGGGGGSGGGNEDRTGGRTRETINLNTPSSASARDRSRSISDQEGDVNIQEAIRLHEAGDLTNSTTMFGQLADPKGANNALSQVLYGLALRHGWGIPPEPDKAIHYLSLAASNSAAVEQAALASGMTKGGAAKGELVLAIFELANCFRYAWGVKKDPVAARQYYETAANLGDTDALDEAAWCYLEGFGGPKDKVRFLFVVFFVRLFGFSHDDLLASRIRHAKVCPVDIGTVGRESAVEDGAASLCKLGRRALRFASAVPRMLVCSVALPLPSSLTQLEPSTVFERSHDVTYTLTS